MYFRQFLYMHAMYGKCIHPPLPPPTHLEALSSAAVILPCKTHSNGGMQVGPREALGSESNQLFQTRCSLESAKWKQ